MYKVCLPPLLLALLMGCGPAPESSADKETAVKSDKAASASQRPVIYQMMTRLFGNKQSHNQAWGSAAQNGVGKFADINDKALAQIKALGANYVWYTGVPHHALVADYQAFGISLDDPDVIKGRAGSPYAVKDYYNVNPDLAEDPAKRLAEFDALIARTHAAGLKVMIDIVPNHVARKYESISKAAGVRDFGADDDTTQAYAKNNNFYYIPGQAFVVPDGVQPLGGEAHPLIDGRFDENPAKWTGNGARSAKPGADDWYETVKINFGVRPDGSYDFPALPADYADKSCQVHLAFWQDKDLPDSWHKFRDIALYWTARGVDGFRYDMAQMVPVEFWSYLNCSIKEVNPDALLLSEIYIPEQYRDYIHLGKMDYLYDKVGTYDALRAIVEGKAGTEVLPELFNGMADIHSHMLMFLENHDEQRIASPEFAGDPRKALPAMVVSSLVAGGANLLYFGQEVGEAGAGDAGFGQASRTTIFDYWGVPAHQRWMNNGAFDGGLLSKEEKALRDSYRDLLNLAANEPALQGEFADLHLANQTTPGYNNQLYSFARFTEEHAMLVVANFAALDSQSVELSIPRGVIYAMGLTNGEYTLTNSLGTGEVSRLHVQQGEGRVHLTLAPLASVAFKLR